jgi:hypothetical protein
MMNKDLKLGAAKVVQWKDIQDKLSVPIHVRALDVLITLMAIAFVIVLFKSWAFLIK